MPRMTAAITTALEHQGFAVMDHVLPGDTLDRVTTAIERHLGDSPLRQAGTRQLHRIVPDVAALIDDASVQRIAQPLLPGAFPVRSIFFDKSPGANWKVAWHQDLAICVQKRIETPGFSAWSVKEGFVHDQPPVSILDRMLTLRIHLDDCTDDNGPLRVMAGSHRFGRLAADEISAWRRDHQPTACIVSRGGILAMKPLLLHASSPAQRPKHRRVIHIEFAAHTLPNGLQWLESRRSKQVSAPPIAC